MISTRMMMIPFHGMSTAMRTSMALDVLVRLLPTEMASVVSGQPMGPKLEVSMVMRHILKGNLSGYVAVEARLECCLGCNQTLTCMWHC